MTNYYFSQNPEVIHHEKERTVQLLGTQLNFITDNGVFSKNRIDYGSKVLLQATEKILFPLQAKILDVGCGYGAIGLTLAKKYPSARIDLIDVNQLALELAKKNAEVNQISNVKIWSSDIYTQVPAQDYQLIITNPPIRAGKKVVHAILTQAFEHLQIGGQLLAVIQKKQGAPSAQKKLQTVFGNCQVIMRDKGYFVLQSCKQGNDATL
ncbi:MAG: class I SAM-dependent methyltransferase [Liquorilactobacillus nagelii]|jgi:16S rRNA (guanine1207-N2)-methyltransferase|uniref:class I SAM-dependent methyltransferase n=1 Tax=Liquorilactobacillus nagelii TaxID=82688 RepID=UPI00243003B9|nr:class I SAM-dependent methyltransferase [Liquorilactobacillus nagelii]MCI1633313.1 class I SAM-dependent methyltransferase [Liquorilactobacillus nagelii]MCI1921829.1 class I SAM-dependent methyltransferase [Liquorilactobacillus nagelii]MCI1976779.1 class I SAM-dependent methyltransferase [Liquorilactobacillus nagelii]